MVSDAAWPPWDSAAGREALARGNVQVLRFRCDVASREPIEQLTAEERARRERFRNADDRIRYTLGRFWLRRLVSDLTGQPEGDLRFDRGPSGKPFLRDTPLQFNLAHSGDIGLLAVHRSAAVGVDVERHRVFEWEQVARHVFTEAEISVFASVAASERPAMFFRCWTRKEAYLKGLGEGFQRDPRKVDLCGMPSKTMLVDGWSVVDLEVGTGCSAAVAFEVPSDLILWALAE